MKKIDIAIGALFLAAPMVLSADTHPAAWQLFVSSYADTVLNPPTGEDSDFFVTTGGIPNLMFLVDTSGSMLRMPPDGAAATWGSFRDTVSGLTGKAGCTNVHANALRFHSACGTLTKEGQPYSASTDWALEKDADGKYCSYMITGNQDPATDKPGFDPDWYCAAGGTTCSGHANFFDELYVYRDAFAYQSFDGWTDRSVNPYKTSVATFCGAYDASRKAQCTSCMATYGYWFDGSYEFSSVTDDLACTSDDDCKLRARGSCESGKCRLPKVYFTGNFLNFHPPKFMLTRKILKDVLAEVRKVRLGLVVFDTSDVYNPWGGDLIKELNPSCNMVGKPSSFDANRSAVKTLIDSTSVKFYGGTPLAESLLNVGQYYSNRDQPWFATKYKTSEFQEKSGSNVKSYCYSCQQSSVLIISDGNSSVDGRIPGTDVSSNPMTLAIANQGRDGAAGEKVYAGDTRYNITGITSTDCPTCNKAAELAQTTGRFFCGQSTSGGCDDNGNAIDNPLPKVAWYLHNVDLRPDTETGADSYKMEGKQVLNTYTIAFGTQGNTTLILRDTAEAGGGLFNGGLEGDVVDARSLKAAIMKTLEDVNTRSTGFGAAAMSPLQAAASQGVLIPRFEPARSAHWNGHLYQYDLYSEFASGTCTIPGSGASGPGNGDYDCDGKCTSVFLKDKTGAFIQENGQGAFVQNLPSNRAACGFGNLCTGTDCGAVSTTKAEPIWDAGDKLAALTYDVNGTPTVKSDATSTNPTSFKGWSTRNVYTVVDSNLDGKITAADTLVKLDGTSTQADALAPYLNIRGAPFCGELASRMLNAGNSIGTTINSEVAAGQYTTCAKTILAYLRGADVFNDLGKHGATCSTFPTTYCTRPYQLGDVFHSSPVEVHPPARSGGLFCDTGFDAQCLAALYRTPTMGPSIKTNNNAYDDYARSDRYKRRAKFTLVGANDGLLHAFHTGTWSDADNKYDAGTGAEVWAFIPPDLLAKLPLFMGFMHQYFVDGTPMVRDVWIDGLANKLSSGDAGAVGKDSVKQGGEFHTVAVVGERRGGTHYFALDVTDAGPDLDGAPKFLWIYPQPSDPEQLSFGNTWADFTPTPPPIGPVRMDKGPGPTCDPNVLVYDGPAGSRCYQEKWIVMLSGGFDQQYTKGRGVHMVDIADGTEVFDFSQPVGAASTCTSASDPRCHLQYPVAAAVGMMSWGRKAESSGASENDYFFDTATFGDTGGQVWVLRFNDPGIVDTTTGKVSNWYGARVFQQNKASALSCGLNYCGTQPFFHITANVALAANGKYRVLLGTGDRYNLLDHAGGICGPDNLRACLQKGCSVTLDDGSGGPGAVYGASGLGSAGTQSYHMNHPASCTSTDPSTYTFTTAAAPSGVTSKIGKYTISCPATVVCPDETGAATAETSTKKMSLSCTIDSATSKEFCVPTTFNDPGMEIDVKSNPDKKNWFYSLAVFESDGSRIIFRTQAEAIAYDVARLTETDLVDINAYETNPTSNPAGSPGDRGWKLFFDHGEPNATASVTLDGSTYHIYRGDERVASTTGIGGGCAFWNTVQPTILPETVNASTECPTNTPCKAGKKQVSYLYGAAPSTGKQCLPYQGSTVRTIQSETVVPPHIGRLVAYLSQNQVSFGLTTVRIPAGGTNLSLGEAQDIYKLQQWLPVDRSTHDCRHADKSGTPPTNCR